MPVHGLSEDGAPKVYRSAGKSGRLRVRWGTLGRSASEARQVFSHGARMADDK